MECICSVLSCGNNGTGHSILVSMEKSIRSEKKIMNRILINVGDGTQRFCQEHRIKLASLSTIIITSLAPHNISGFPGIFLALSDLGVGEIKMFGPPGLKAYLQHMTPFINRKYPALNVTEIEFDSSEEVKVKCARLSFYSVRAEMSGQVVGLACQITPLDDQTFSFFPPAPVTVITVLPLADYFPTLPSLSSLFSSLSCSAVRKKVVFFSPLASLSCMRRGGEMEGTGGGVGGIEEIKRLCEEYKAIGIVLQNQPTREEIEFSHTHSTLSLLHTLYPPLFPAPLHSTPLSPPTPYTPSLLPVSYVGSRLLESQIYLSRSSSLVIDIEEREGEEGAGEGEREGLTCHLYSPTPLSSLSLSLLSTLIKREESSLPPTLSRPPSPPPPSPQDNHQAAAHLFSRLALKRKYNPLEKTLPPLPPPPSSSSFSPNTPFPPPSLLLPSSLPTLPSPLDEGGEREDSEQLLRSSNTISNSPLPPPVSSSSTVPPSSLPLSAQSPSLISLPSVPPPHPVGDSVEVSFLGTGCATPSKHRSNSAILLRCVGSMSREGRYRGEGCRRESLQSNNNINFNVNDNVNKESNNSSSIHLSPPLQTPTIPLSSSSPSSFSPHSTSKKRGNHLSLDLSFLQEAPAPSLQSRPLPSASPLFIPTEDVYVLLDCGENVTCQLFTLLQGDPKRFDHVLSRIKVVWISHHHTDHAVGIACLLQHIYAARLRRSNQLNSFSTSNSNNNSPNPLTNLSYGSQTKKTPPSFFNKYTVKQHAGSIGYETGKVMIIATETVLKYVDFVVNIAGLDDLVSLYPITQTQYAGCTTDIMAATEGMIKRLVSIPVPHCQSSFGIVLETCQQQKIVYSGDCRPSQSLVKNGMGCDILIHEATFADDRAADAIKKKHSTYSEAIDIAKKMQAKYTILTHFSQRYPLSHLNDHNDSSASCAAFAYDFLHFNYPSQMRVLAEATRSIAHVLHKLENSPSIASTDIHEIDDDVVNANDIPETNLYEQPELAPLLSRQSTEGNSFESLGDSEEVADVAIVLPASDACN